MQIIFDDAEKDNCGYEYRKITSKTLGDRYFVIRPDEKEVCLRYQEGHYHPYQKGMEKRVALNDFKNIEISFSYGYTEIPHDVKVEIYPQAHIYTFKATKDDFGDIIKWVINLTEDQLDKIIIKLDQLLTILPFNKSI